MSGKVQTSLQLIILKALMASVPVRSSDSLESFDKFDI